MRCATIIRTSGVKVIIFVQINYPTGLSMLFPANRLKEKIGIFLIILIALLARRYDAFINPQLFAEDGNVYFIQFEQYGIKSLLIPYGGYLHFVPRLVVAFWGILKVNYFYLPACYSFSEFVITFFIAVSIWNSGEYLGIKHRMLYAVSFLLLPIASDIFMNLTNINWITSLYLINFLFARPDYKNKYLNLAVLFIISLSGPFSTLLIPVILAALFFERKNLSIGKMAPLLFMLLGGIIQLIYIAFIDTGFYRGVSAPPEQYHLLKLITNNIREYFFLSQIKWLSGTVILFISFVIFLFLLYVFIRGYIKINNKRKYMLLWYAIITLISFIKAYWPNESQILGIYNARYYFIPFTCIAWLMILSFDKEITLIYSVGYFALFLILSKHIRMILPDKHWKTEIAEYYQGKREVIDINPKGFEFTMPKRGERDSIPVKHQ